MEVVYDELGVPNSNEPTSLPSSPHDLLTLSHRSCRRNWMEIESLSFCTLVLKGAS